MPIQRTYSFISYSPYVFRMAEIWSHIQERWEIPISSICMSYSSAFLLVFTVVVYNAFDAQMVRENRFENCGEIRIRLHSFGNLKGQMTEFISIFSSWFYSLKKGQCLGLVNLSHQHTSQNEVIAKLLASTQHRIYQTTLA